MTAPTAPRQPRQARWPFACLLLLVPAALWLLDGHQPRPWADAATPWFSQAVALAPGARAIDWANTALPWTPDLAPASVLVLVLLGLSTLGTLLAHRISPLLALGVTCGVLATRSAWSAVTPGTDALPVLLVSLAVTGLFAPHLRVLALAAAGLGVPLVAPYAAWALAPALARRTTVGARALLVGAAVLATVAVLAAALLLRAAWIAVPCLEADAWPLRLRQVLQPGLSAAVSPTLAIRQFAGVLLADVHMFGLLSAAWGLTVAREARPGTRASTLIAVGLTSLAVCAGFLPPALAAALLLPWWAPWCATGLESLLPAAGWRRTLASALLAALAAASPALRTGEVVPEPWSASLAETTRAVSSTWSSAALVAEGSPARARQWRSHGVPTMPLDAEVGAACLAKRIEVHAMGESAQHLERNGLRLVSRPSYAPLASVLADVRSRQLVALGLSASALPYAGPHGIAAISRLAQRRVPLVATSQLGIIAMTDAPDGRVETGRAGLEVRVAPGDAVGGHVIESPLAVNAQPDAVTIDSPPRGLVHSATGAVVVFDRFQAVTLRAATGAAPGLPVLLTSLPAWRHVVAERVGSCQAVSEGWTRIDGAPRRISVPTIGAAAGRPVRLYLTANQPPRVGIEGLPIRPTRPEWLVDGFDRQQPPDEARLRSALAADGVAPTLLPPSRHVVRIELRPGDLWPPARVSLSAGVAPHAWLVAGVRTGRTPESTRVCGMSEGGDRLLAGHSGSVDDDSDRELTVWARDGWHRAELAGDQPFQWSAVASPSVGFRLATPQSLVLAMDAAGASVAGTAQPLQVSVNGTIIEARWQGARRVEIPSDLLKAGENTLVFSVPRTVQPPGDSRTLGVLVRQLRLIAPRR